MACQCFQGAGETEVVPPHLDERLLTSKKPEPGGSEWLKGDDLAGARLINTASLVPAAVTYTCTQISQNTPTATDCANPPSNNYPTFDLILTATIVATNSQTHAQTTTTFTTSGTATGMCEYYIDCDGDLVNTDWPGYADPSGPDTENDGTAVGTAFWWQLSKYGPEASGACDCDDPDPYGTVWNNTSGYALTPIFWVAENGNTTSNCAGLVLELD